jgi:hypothetical protein
MAGSVGGPAYLALERWGEASAAQCWEEALGDKLSLGVSSDRQVPGINRSAPARETGHAS